MDSLGLPPLSSLALDSSRGERVRPTSAREAAEQFEAIFLEQVIQSMKTTVESEDDSEEMSGKSTYMDMMYRELAVTLAHSGGIGLRELIGDQLEALQAARTNPPASPPLPAAGPASEATRPEVAPKPPAGSQVGSLRVSSPLGLRVDPFTHTLQMHKGVDLPAPAGTLITAVHAGEVRFSGWEGSFGKTIVVQGADGTEVRYAHLQEVNVDAGQQIVRGQVIGTVGSTGRSTGPHLHLEASRDGAIIDPLELIDSR